MARHSEKREHKPGRWRLKKLAKRGVQFLVAIVVMLVGLFLLLQTPAGKQRLAAVISATVVGPGFERVEVHDIRGFVPFDFSIGDVRVWDSGQQWLSVENALVRIRAKNLLRGHISVSHVSADRIAVVALPERDKPKTREWKMPSIPELPAWLTVDQADVRTLHLSEAVIGTESEYLVSGHFRPLQDGRFDLAARLRRTDADTTRAHALVLLEGNRLDVSAGLTDSSILPQIIGVDETVQFAMEGAGPLSDWQGTVETAIGETQLVDLRVALSGDPDTTLRSSGWVVLDERIVPPAIRDRVGRRADLEFNARLDRTGLLTLQQADVTTEVARASVSGQTHLEDRTVAADFRVRHDDVSRIAAGLDDLEGDSLGVDSTYSGSWDAAIWNFSAILADEPLMSAELDLTFESGIRARGNIQIHPAEDRLPEAYAPMLASAITGDLDVAYNTADQILTVYPTTVTAEWVNTDFRGEWYTADNRVDASVEIALLNAAPLRELVGFEIGGSGRLSAQLEGNPSATNASADLVLASTQFQDLTVDGVTLNATLAGGSWPDNVIRPADLSIAGGVQTFRFRDQTVENIQIGANADRSSEGAIVVHDVRVANADARIDGQGEIASEFETARFAVTAAVDEIGAILRLVELPYTGSLELNGVAEYTEELAGWSGNLEAIARDLQELPDPTIQLLGPQATLAAQFAFADQALRVDDVNLDAANAMIEGQGTYGFSDRRYTANLQLTVPELAVLEDWASVPLDGSIVLTASGEGGADSFNLSATATNDGLLVDTADFSSVRLEAKAGGAYRDLTGRVSANVQANQRLATAIADFGLQDRVLDVTHFVTRMPFNEIEGAGSIHLTEFTGSGQVRARLNDLAVIGVFAGQELAGELYGQVAVEAEEPGSRLDVELETAFLDTPALTLTRGRINGTVDNFLDDPVGQVDAELASLTLGDTRLDSATIAAELGEGSLSVDLKADGAVQRTIPVDARSQFAYRWDEGVVAFEQLTGNVGDRPVALAQPTQFEFTDSGIRIAPIELRIAEGEARIQGVWAESELDVTASWQDIPASLADLARFPVAAGALSGDLRLRGTPARPEGTFTLRAVDVKSAAMAEDPDSAPLIADASATLAPNAVTGQATLRFAESTGVEADINVPGTYSLQPVKLSASEDQPWSGDLVLDVALAEISALLNMRNQVFQGRVQGEFALAGSLDAPDIRGSASLQQGRYENIGSGTILENVQLTLEARGDSLVLTHATAGDGAGGNVTGEGRLDLNYAEGFPFDTTLSLTEARLVNRDDMDAQASGTVSFAGSLDSMNLAGDLTLGPTTIILRPNQTEDVVQLAVIEKQRYGSDEIRREPAPPRGPTIALDIDIEVPGRAFVLAQDMRTEWQGTLHVTGTTAEPIIQGDLSIVQGQMSFLGRRFRFERESSVAFDTKTSDSPYLNLTATATRQQTTAFLTMRGTLDDMNVDIRSEPALPQEEILALMLFGRNVSEISPVQALQLARAVAIFSGTLDGVPFFSGPSRLPVVDTLDVEMREGTPVVGVGKYLSDDVFLQLEQGTAAETSRAKVEISVTPQITVETSVGANAQGGLGLFWKWDY